MQILHVETAGVLNGLALEPLDTVMHFDQTEIELVADILQGFLEMFEDENDEFKQKLEYILSCVIANIPTSLN